MKKILIVEDEAAYLNLLSDKLSARGYQIVLAENGQMGLTQAIKEKPDLIILDVRMPVMDGTTMLAVLRKTQDIKSTKVVMLTNLEPDEKMIGSMIKDQPIYYFVKSDMQFKELLTKIEELI